MQSYLDQSRHSAAKPPNLLSFIIFFHILNILEMLTLLYVLILNYSRALKHLHNQKLWNNSTALPLMEKPQPESKVCYFFKYITEIILNVIFQNHKISYISGLFNDSC